MEISRPAAAFVAAALITAGAGGAYFATRDGDSIAETAIAQTTDSAAEATFADPAAGTGGNVAPAAAPAPRTAESPRRQVVMSRPAVEPAPDSVGRIEPAPPTAAPVVEERPTPPAPDPAPIVENEPARVPEPTGPELLELVVSAESVIGLQLDSSLTSERARVEDEVLAHVVRDVRVGDRVAVPAGSKVHGEVTLVERGGKVKERARLGVRFHSIVLPNGTRLPIRTEPIIREGDSQAGSSTAKIGGGAIGGAIIGGILGGAKGAAIGSSVGAGAGTAAVMTGGRNQATLPAGSPLTIRIEDPLVVTMEK